MNKYTHPCTLLEHWEYPSYTVYSEGHFRIHLYANNKCAGSTCPQDPEYGDPITTILSTHYYPVMRVYE